MRITWFENTDSMIVDFELEGAEDLTPHDFPGDTVLFTDQEGRIAEVKIMSGASRYRQGVSVEWLTASQAEMQTERLE